MPIATGALIGGAAISGLSNIVGNIFGKKSQDKANETNLKINQMNNDFNAREAEKAFLRESQYNDRIRAEDRAYNSAAAQVERYRQAGLNPALMMQGQSAGIAQSSGVSSSAASAAPSAPQQGFRPDFGMLGSAIEGLLDRSLQKDLLREQVNGIRIENQYKTQQILAQIENTKADSLSKSAKAKLDNTIESMQKGMMQSVIDSNVQEATYRKAMTAYQAMINERVPDDIASQIALRLAQSAYYRFHSKDDVRNFVNSFETAIGKNLPESVKNGIFGAISIIK